jgi:hypothetical protein
MTMIELEIPPEIEELISGHLGNAISKADCPVSEEEKIVALYEEAKGGKTSPNEFVTTSDDSNTYVAEAPKGLYKLNDPPKATLWFWNSFLCPLYTLTLSWASHKGNKYFSLRAHIPFGSQEWTSLLNRETINALLA